jgi:hypothetical protein
VWKGVITLGSGSGMEKLSLGNAGGENTVGEESKEGGLGQEGLGKVNGKGIETREGGKLLVSGQDGDDDMDNDDDGADVHIVHVLGTAKESAELTELGVDVLEEDAKQFPLNLGTYEKRPEIQTIHMFEFRATAPEHAEFAAEARVSTALPHKVQVGQLCTPVTTDVELIMWSPDKSAQLKDLRVNAEVSKNGANASSATTTARGIQGDMSLALTSYIAGPRIHAQYSQTATSTERKGSWWIV